MKDENKQIIIERILQNPAPVFGGEWTQKGKAWQTQRGAIRLLPTASGANLVIWGNHGSGFAGERIDAFTYLQERVLNTSDFWDTLQTCAERYGVDLKQSPEQVTRIQRQRLAREVAPSLCAALMENRTGKAWQYLAQRGIVPDGVHYGELTTESIARAKDALSAHGLTYTDDDFKALKLTPDQAAKGYNVVLPYYRNGVVVGFLFRDVTGTQHKYDAPQDMKRGYCDRLTHGEPAYIVEGEIDALRLRAAGYPNVIAMGGAGMSEELAGLFDANEIHQVTYIPDLEYNDQGEKRTDLIDKAIKRFQSATVDGERVITNLFIAEFPTPEGVTLSNYKMDADTYGNDQGADALRNVVNAAVDWWGYELGAFEDWATTNDTVQRGEFERRFMDIYNRCATPIERERLRQYIEGQPLIYAEQGITRATLLDVDEMHRQTEYNNRMREGAQALARAIENGANPATVGDILAKMAQAQSTNTRDEWDKQLTATFEDELRAIREQPETLRTKWELGTLTPDKTNPLIKKYKRNEFIEFYPATITVFAAATSHGKTSILLQSALDLVKFYPNKTFLYVSCEEPNRLLLERALNVYMDIDTTETGTDNLNNYCMIKGTRKRAIKAALGGCTCPPEYAEQYNAQQERKRGEKWTWSQEHPTPPNWENLSVRIKAAVEQYGERVRPRLKLIHTDGSAESIAANVRRYFEQYRAQGVEIGGVFVDYMQLLTSDNKTTARNYELKDVCKALADCATETELPIIVAAQLNRDALRQGVGQGLDNVTVANLGEAADIERIAHDLYLIWQVDKTRIDAYTKFEMPKDEKGKAITDADPVQVLDVTKIGTRSRRIMRIVKNEQARTREIELKKGYLYIEQMKARDGKTDGWGLFPFEGEQGRIGTIDTELMGQE